MKKTLSAAFIVATLAMTSACGGGSDGGGGGGSDDNRPAKSDVSQSLTSKDSVFGSTIPKSAADCVAGALVDSKLSDKTLDAIVKGDKSYNGSKADQKALTGLTTKFGACVTK